MGNIEKFDMIANQYDTPERMEIAEIITDAIRARITNGKEKTAIDYGCGTGLVGMNLLDDFKTVLFVDASQNMIKQVRQKIEALHVQNAETLCNDFANEFPQNIYADYVIVAQTLLHMKDIEPLLRRLHTILNGGGHLIIVDFDKNDEIISDEVHNGFEQEKLIKMVESLGFTKSYAKTFYHREKMFMNKDASLFIVDAEKCNPPDVGPFYHGTKADLKIGDLIEPGYSSNYGIRKKANFVYFSATMEAAIWGAELAVGNNPERIYIVEPTGEFDNDPNLTDKKFPGNPTRSYRTRRPVRVVGEVSKWEGHSPEVLQSMLENLADLKRQGIEAINE